MNRITLIIAVVATTLVSSHAFAQQGYRTTTRYKASTPGQYQELRAPEYESAPSYDPQPQYRAPKKYSQPAPHFGCSGKYIQGKGYYITKVVPGSKAYRMGLRCGHVIKKIDNQPVYQGCNLNKCVQYARSSKKTSITLLVDYIRTWQPSGAVHSEVASRHGEPAVGHALYRANCASCLNA